MPVYTNAVKVQTSDKDVSIMSPNLEKYPSGLEDEHVKRGLHLISTNNSDKSARDKQNQLINDILKEATTALDPTAPRYIGAKRLKQAKSKTAERIRPLSFTLQGDGASEEEEIMVTQAVKEVLHRGGYDWTFSGKNGVVDKILSYGDCYRLIEQQDKETSHFPIKFRVIDSNNLWFNTNATSFREGNKNVTQLVALFKGTMREFYAEFPECEGEISPGMIPRDFTYKDLDQTRTQQFQTYGTGTVEDMEIEWAYMFDIQRLAYTLVAGSQLQILEQRVDKKYPYVFKNVENKKIPYIPVSNYICLPSEEGIYNVGLLAFLYDMGITFRSTVNDFIAFVKENTHPHTLINIPQGQESSFFNLIEMANQLRASGGTPYIPITYNPAGDGKISTAQPILNGGDPNSATLLMNRIDDEFRKCGVYLDEPINSAVTATQIEYNASNALTLPKAIMKYNAAEIEFEIMVAIDMIKKYVSQNDKTPLILDTTIELSEGTFETRGIPFTLGWLRYKLLERAWRVKTDEESGAVTNNSMMIAMYQKLLPNIAPGTPEYNAIVQKIATLTGFTIPKQALTASTGKDMAVDVPGNAPGNPLLTIPTGGQAPSKPPSARAAAGIGY